MKGYPRYYMVVLMGFVALSYWPSLTAGFVRDDYVVILRARSVALSQEFNPFFPGHVEDYRPVRKAFSKAMTALCGAKPLPFHLVSLFFHLVCVFLAYRVGARFFGEGGGYWVAALFALHPGPSEAVMWPAALSSPMSTMFALGAVWAFFSDKGAARWLSAPLAALAYLTHESTAPLVAVFAAMAWGEGRLREYRPVMLAHGVLSLIFVLLWFSGPFGQNQPVAAGGWGIGPHGPFHIVEYMISLTLYPGLYLYPQGEGWLGFLREPLWLHVSADLFFGAALIALFAALSRREKAWLISAMALVAPVSFFTWGNSSRYLHLPLFFWSMAVVSVGWRLRERSAWKPVISLVFIVLLSLYGMNDFTQSIAHRREADEIEGAMRPIVAAASNDEKKGVITVHNCPMHTDHVNAAVRVALKNPYFKVICDKVELTPHAPPRRR